MPLGSIKPVHGHSATTPVAPSPIVAMWEATTFLLTSNALCW
jgi:hypothetical protein